MAGRGSSSLWDVSISKTWNYRQALSYSPFTATHPSDTQGPAGRLGHGTARLLDKARRAGSSSHGALGRQHGTFTAWCSLRVERRASVLVGTFGADLWARQLLPNAMYKLGPRTCFSNTSG